jgi:hypothetical protein
VHQRQRARPAGRELSLGDVAHQLLAQLAHLGPEVVPARQVRPGRPVELLDQVHRGADRTQP